MSLGLDPLAAILSIVGGLFVVIVGAVVIVIFKGASSLVHAWQPLVTLFFATLALGGMAWIGEAARSRSARVLWNCVLLAGVLAGYFATVQRSALSMIWLAYAVALVVAVQAGALLFLTYREKTIQRLVRHFGDPNDSQPYCFESSFRQHSAVYVALPIGAVLGAFGTMLEIWEPDDVRWATIGCIFGTAGLMLCVFLIRDTRRLFAPHMMRDGVPHVTFHHDGVVRIPHSDARDPSEEEKKGVLDAAVAATEVRKLCLYNQYQMLAVLVTSVLVVLTVMNVRLLDVRVCVPLVVFALAVSQLPFVVGQRLAHARALEPYSGVEREKLREQVEKYAEVFPKAKTWIALTGSGTIGAVANSLLAKLLGS